MLTFFTIVLMLNLALFACMWYNSYTRAKAKAIIKRAIYGADRVSNPPRLWKTFVLQSAIMLKNGKCKNFLTFAMDSEMTGKFDVTIRYWDGITPLERIHMLEKEIEQLKGR